MTTFTYDESVIQYDTIPTTGTYDIVASGGQGGNGPHFSPDDAGGLAACAGGDIFLQAGAVLEIVVGGAGSNSTPEYGAGGGGGIAGGNGVGWGGTASSGIIC